MFSPGEKVVYPMHGIAVVEGVEDHEVLGRKQKYYILKLLLSGMKVMVPVDSAEKVGLRGMISKDKVSKVFDILKGKKTDSISDWKIRYNTNLEKMKTGSIFKVAEVARSLSIRSRRQGLSSGDRRLLNSACQLIAEELSYVEGQPIGVMNMMVGKILENSPK